MAARERVLAGARDAEIMLAAFKVHVAEDEALAGRGDAAEDIALPPGSRSIGNGRVNFPPSSGSGSKREALSQIDSRHLRYLEDSAGCQTESGHNSSMEFEVILKLDAIDDIDRLRKYDATC